MRNLFKFAFGLILIAYFIGKFSSDSSSSTQALTKEESAPEGYEKGLTCSVCEGTGRYLRDLALIPNTKGNPCASCNGKGFNWRKKSSYDNSYSSSSYSEPVVADNQANNLTTFQHITDDIIETKFNQNENANNYTANEDQEEDLNAAIIYKEYKGNVGELSTVYKIRIINKLITGTYYYPTRPNITYKLEGNIEADGTMKLTEYTEEEQTALCILSKSEDKECYVGKMNNTDGRSFEMTLCE